MHTQAEKKQLKLLEDTGEKPSDKVLVNFFKNDIFKTAFIALIPHLITGFRQSYASTRNRYPSLSGMNKEEKEKYYFREYNYELYFIMRDYLDMKDDNLYENLRKMQIKLNHEWD